MGAALSAAPAVLQQPVIRVPLFVADSRGRFVEVTASTFQVLEDDAPASVTNLLLPNEPLEVMVGLDISASMERVLPEIAPGVNAFLTAMRDVDNVRLLAFSDRVSEVPRGRSWSTALDALIPRGATAFHDGLLDAIRRFGRDGASRRALVVFTDGFDKGSRASLTTALEEILTTDIVLYLVLLGPDKHTKQRREQLDEIAAATGGRAIRASITQVSRAFDAVRQELATYCVLTYRSHRPAPDGRRHTIEVRAAGRRDLRLRARRLHMH